MRQQLILLLFLICTFLAPLSDGFAHGGDTDSKGGHYDRSTGLYHYHHGYSAHQHPNGVCPYDISYGSTSNSVKVVTAAPRLASSGTPRPAVTMDINSFMQTVNIIAQREGIRPSAQSATKPTAKPTYTPPPIPTFPPTARPTSLLKTDTSDASLSASAKANSPHVWNYLLLGGFAFTAVLVAISTSRARSQEQRNFESRIKVQVDKAKEEANKAAEKEIQHAYSEISALEQKLKDAYKRIDDLRDELQAALTPPPKLKFPRPVQSPEPQFEPLPYVTSLYQTKYPKTWGYIQNNVVSPDSYIPIYHYYWGKLQEHHGDGIVFGTLSEEEQSYVRYLPFGDTVYLSDNKSDTYHLNPNCYSLLRTAYLTVDSIHANGRKRCSKCVPPN